MERTVLPLYYAVYNAIVIRVSRPLVYDRHLISSLCTIGMHIGPVNQWDPFCIRQTQSWLRVTYNTCGSSPAHPDSLPNMRPV